MSCKCDTNRAGHFTLDAHASRPVACTLSSHYNSFEDKVPVSEIYRHLIFKVLSERLKKLGTKIVVPGNGYHGEKPNLSHVQYQATAWNKASENVCPHLE